MTDAERATHRLTVDNAIASQRLEGLEPDAEVIEQLRDYAEGRREIGDIVEELHKRIVGGRLQPGAGKP
ncbi:antitoxin VbhA family protein [Pseudomonas cavernae]|nr:antitoxin VbhA family protein [Pseudomonas cavernae]